ncbi:hypothetical protein SKAU_G00420730 [Synaphobranchus kaupii]|uniref:C2H2-type domain-containing protein n=1 Tax=Synaphobranchus kaupii TaxID=118154 RepID=A0A9Q1E6L5_SYNKA|nr:hypothetical protein SKAU_G00420730 [Synaphobranchus kaupii]
MPPTAAPTPAARSSTTLRGTSSSTWPRTGITFTEEDFAAQRERKRKPADPFAEIGAAKKTVQEELPGGESREAGGAIRSPVPTTTATSSTSSSSSLKEPRGTLTCVAVCFDGRKFTCGFESCGRTFTQASDVQRHLKCVHPGQIKSEKKGQKRLSKVKGLRTREKDIKIEQGSTDKSALGHASCPLAQGVCPERSYSPAAEPHKPFIPPPLSPLIDDPLKDLLLGLSRLSLRASSPRSSLCDPCHPISGSSVSQVSCSPTLSANASPSAAKASRKKAAPKPQPTIEKKQTPPPPPRPPSPRPPSPPPEQPTPARRISDFLVQPSTKPYGCEVKSCGFKSVTSSALKVHYLRKHSFSKDRGERDGHLQD